MTQIIDIKQLLNAFLSIVLAFNTSCMNSKPERMISKLRDVEKIEIVINRDFYGDSYQIIEKDPETIKFLLESFTLWGAGGKPEYPIERFNCNGKLIFHLKNNAILVLDIDLLSGQGSDSGFRIERKGRVEYTFFTKATDQILVGIICDHLAADI